MKKKRLTLTSVLVLIGTLSVACSVSTANLSSLKVGKDQNVSQETNTFASADTVYAVATVANAPGKVKVKGQLAIEDVSGEKPGPIPGLEKTLELDGSGKATFTFSPPADGWPKGKYKIEVVMMNEQGEQKDQESATFTVS
jgi:hypothetical protein